MLFELILGDCRLVEITFEVPGFGLKLKHFSNFRFPNPLPLVGLLDLLNPSCSALDPFEPKQE